MELLPVIVKVFNDVFDKIARIFSTAWGWISSLIVFVFTWTITWIGDTREICVYLVFAAVIIDLIWGIASSAKRGLFALSSGIIKLGIKLAVYFSILTMSVLIEKSISNDWVLVFQLTTAVLIVAECISICGHILIIKPDTPIIKLLWKVLRSEIAKKLGIEVKDLDDYVNTIKKTNSNESN